MKNKLQDLNDHLFAQLERLSAEDLKGDDLVEEISRADAISEISDQIVKTASVRLKAAQLFAQHGTGVLEYLPAIGGEAKPKIIDNAQKD